MINKCKLYCFDLISKIKVSL